jgi:hypothetical protein
MTIKVYVFASMMGKISRDRMADLERIANGKEISVTIWPPIEDEKIFQQWFDTNVVGEEAFVVIENEDEFPEEYIHEMSAALEKGVRFYVLRPVISEKRPGVFSNYTSFWPRVKNNF